MELTGSSGHYDILYKLEDLPTSSPVSPQATQNLFVGFTHGQTTQLDTPSSLPFSATNFEIPGMEFFPSQHGAQKSWTPLVTSFSYQTAPVQSPPPVNNATRSLPIRTVEFPHLRTSSNVSDYYNGSNPPSHVITPTSPISPGYGPPLIDSSRFRPSKFEFERDYIAMSSGAQIYQTPIFKK
jgi:hypothetical protein